MRKFIVLLLLSFIVLISCQTQTITVNNTTVIVENGYLLPYDSSVHPYKGRNFYKADINSDIKYFYIDDVTYGQYQQINYGKMIRGKNGWFEKDDIVYGSFAFIGTYGEFIESASQEIADRYYNGCNIRKDKTIIVSRRVKGNEIVYDDLEKTIVGYFEDSTYKNINLVNFPDVDYEYIGEYTRNDKP